MKLLQMAKIKKTMSAALLLLMLAPMPALAADKNAAAPADPVKEVLNLLEKNHVSAPTHDSLSASAIKGMVESLKDPYTVYFTKDEWKQFTNSLEQNYVGIGVRVGEDKEGILVVEVFADTPAAAVGLQRGDIITAVEGKPIAGEKLDDVIKKILGEEGTQVGLTVKRGDSSFDVKPTRKQVQIPVVTSHLFDGGVGYIQVTSFSSEADEQFASHMETLKKNGMKSLVIDLRDNPGGLLDTARGIAKLFVKEGTLIHTKDRDNADDPVPITNGTTQPFPVTMLVNENSASASEVLTGALQDYLQVHVVGTKTFGKGSVQNVFPLSNGGALKVTIEEYLTPKKRPVNQVGLTPDIPAEGDVPQLVTALRTAGLSGFKLDIDRRNISLNGFDLTDSFNVVQQNDRLYVPARVLAALVNAAVTWNDAAQSVEIASSAGSISYAVGSNTEDMIFQNGTTYVDVSRFAETFSQLKWSQSGGQISLSVG
ncbi:S41 family peptidase [Paenibacillus hamazuiensis]|uniref:S41 family peptidase n=1 Tax=Paenibacillus hamazuiensis TaxID=2936508 RepID=UPI0020108970|nr:S41 family peptidase [Paenibacillus hamazuiensis]